MSSPLLADPPRAAASTVPAASCANCQAPQMGEYCYVCGQHFLEGRLTIRRLVLDFIVRKLGWEGGLLRTLVELTVRPSAMIRDYVDGRRQRYTNPVAYLLLTAGLYVLLSGTWADEMAAGMRAGMETEGVEVQSFTESLVQVQLYMDSHPSLLTLLLCLCLVPTLRLLFRRTTTTAEATVFALFVSGHLMLVQVAIALGARAVSADIYRALTGPAAVVPTMVLLFSAGRFFGTRFTSFLKVAVALAITLAGMFLLMIMAIVVISALATAAPASAAG